MADFFQTGVVTTLHRLNRNDDDVIEAELVAISDNNRIGLVLPALYVEFEHPAMQQIVDELRTVRYLRRIVVAIGHTAYRGAGAIALEIGALLLVIAVAGLVYEYIERPTERSLRRRLRAPSAASRATE